MSIKQYKKRSDVPKEYKWDLDYLLDGKTIEVMIDELLKSFKKLIKIKDSKYETSSAFLAAVKIEEEVGLIENRVHNYISNNISVNVVDDKFNQLEQKLSFEMYELRKEMGSETNRFFKNIDKIKEWIKLPEFENIKHGLVGQLEEEKHKLSDEIQEFRIKESRADISATEVFSILTNSELDYGYAVDSKGEKIKVTVANRSVLAKHADKNVRKSAAISYRDAFLKHKGTLSNLLYQHFKNASTWAQIEKHDSAVESLIFSDRADKKLLETMYKAVQTNKKIFEKRNEYHRKFYKAKFGEKMTKYDWAVDLVDVKSDWSVEESKETVKEAMKPFGKEYGDIVSNMFKDGWVDFMPVDNKRSGAYSIGGTYGIEKKFILMNFDGTLNSVGTLAHELGHSMHSYYSDKTQTYENAQYPIFIAEIASIFNELMLFDHLLENSDDKEMNFYIRQNMITGFMGTVMRQTEWSNYEYDIYNMVDEGKPAGTYETLAKAYYDNSLKYKIDKPEEFKIEDQFPSIYVPHFYYNFYVYKYAIGQLCGNIFFQKYKSEGPEALQIYIDKFLSAGAKDWPLNILKESGIDLYDENVYKLGFDAADKNVVEWIKLGKEIFGVE